MTIDEFFGRLRGGVLNRKFKFKMNYHKEIRLAKRGMITDTCPVCAVAGIDGCDWREAAKILSLRQSSADKIAQAADMESYPIRERLIKACGL